MSLLPVNLHAFDVTKIEPRGPRVPNVQPVIPADYRIAIIGECPSQEEAREGKPLSGPTGRFMSSLLGAVGIARSACLVGNVCQFRPPNNDLSTWGSHSEEVQDSLDILKKDVAAFNPHLVLLVGKWALWAATGEHRSVHQWRGSVFRCNYVDSPFFGRKCMATFSALTVLKQYELSPLLRFDFRRARKQGLSPDLQLPDRRFDIDLKAHEIVDRLERINESVDPVWVSFDLEGWWDRITRYSIATTPSSGFIVPFTAGEFGSVWSVDEEMAIWKATSKLLQNPRHPKILQNSLYDSFVLAYKHKIRISNVAWDTMLGHWEMYAELDKGLDLQASIYTLEPYWKNESKSLDLRTRYEYCCKDSAVTKEIQEAQVLELSEDPAAEKHFKFNMELLNPFLYMELRGLAYDQRGADEAKAKYELEVWDKQHRLNLTARKDLETYYKVNMVTLLVPMTLKQFALNQCKEILCKKREAAYIATFQQLPAAALKAEIPACNRIAAMDRDGAFDGHPTAATLGELEFLLGIGLNVNSNKQMCEYLYVVAGFERQWKEDKKKGTTALTADVGALLTLFRKTKDDTLKLVLQIRSHLYIINILSTATDPDGRIRCGYNIVGTDTGRIACYESPTGSGYNLQTVTKKLRYLFTADPGHYFFQCDLAGADGWTVAAHCSRHGDDTMMQDYLGGIKPAKVLALMFEHGASVNNMSRPELKEACKGIDQEGWLYFGCKRVQHGSNYDMRPPTMSLQILKDSYKYLGDPIYVEPKITKQLQEFYFIRYRGVLLWRAWVEQQLIAKASLTAASGRTRRFFGRIRESDGRCNHETIKAALSNEPQDNTTYACDLALHKCWHDPENRRSNGSVIIEPLHQVHDAFIGQFPIELVEWARPRIRSYFATALHIAGQDITIPFEGGFGPNWKDINVGTI